MRKKFIILVIIGFIFFLYRSNPDFENHIAKISSDLLENSSISEEVDEKIREGLEYKNYSICSATQSKEKGTMVSVGILRRVKVVNDKWAENTVKP